MGDEGSGQYVRQSPRKRNEDLRVADITMMVRVPGRPAAVRLGGLECVCSSVQLPVPKVLSDQSR